MHRQTNAILKLTLCTKDKMLEKLRRRKILALQLATTSHEVNECMITTMASDFLRSISAIYNYKTTVPRAAQLPDLAACVAMSAGQNERENFFYFSLSLYRIRLIPLKRPRHSRRGHIRGASNNRCGKSQSMSHSCNSINDNGFDVYINVFEFQSLCM